MFGIEFKYFVGLIGLIAIFMVLSQIFWVWMIIDCLKKETDEYSQRGLWLSVLMIGNVVTAMIYYALRYRKREDKIKKL